MLYLMHLIQDTMLLFDEICELLHTGIVVLKKTTILESCISKSQGGNILFKSGLLSSTPEKLPEIRIVLLNLLFSAPLRHECC